MNKTKKKTKDQIIKQLKIEIEQLKIELNISRKAQWDLILNQMLH